MCKMITKWEINAKTFFLLNDGISWQFPSVHRLSFPYVEQYFSSNWMEYENISTFVVVFCFYFFIVSNEASRIFALIFVYNQFFYQFLVSFYFCCFHFTLSTCCSVDMKLSSKTIALIWWIIASELDSLWTVPCVCCNINSIFFFSGCKAEFPYSSSRFGFSRAFVANILFMFFIFYFSDFLYVYYILTHAHMHILHRTQHTYTLLITL